MLGYLPADIIRSEKRAVFRECSSSLGIVSHLSRLDQWCASEIIWWIISDNTSLLAINSLLIHHLPLCSSSRKNGTRTLRTLTWLLLRTFKLYFLRDYNSRILHVLILFSSVRRTKSYISFKWQEKRTMYLFDTSSLKFKGPGVKKYKQSCIK